MGGINWIIWVGSKCNHKGTYKNETEDLTQRKSHVKEAKGNGVIEDATPLDLKMEEENMSQRMLLYKLEKTRKHIVL